MYKLITKYEDARDWLMGKKTYLLALVTFVASLKGAHGSVETFLNSANGLHAELATLAATLRAAIGHRS